MRDVPVAIALRSPLHVVNNILKRAFDQSVDVTPMKLQRLLYFAACDYGTLTDGEPLFNESFAAWEYGPALRTVYEKFRPFNGVPIRRYSRDAAGRGLRLDEAANPKLGLAIDRIWGPAKLMRAVDLSRLAVVPGSAWSKAWHAGADGIISPADVASDRTYLHLLGLRG